MKHKNRMKKKSVWNRWICFQKNVETRNQKPLGTWVLGYLPPGCWQHKPQLWRTLKTNLETFNGRCHSEKCRAWWAECFVIFRGNCSWFYGVKFTLCIFFQPTYNTSHTKPQRWRQLQNVQKTFQVRLQIENVELGELNILRYPKPSYDHEHSTYTYRHAILAMA